MIFRRAAHPRTLPGAGTSRQGDGHGRIDTGFSLAINEVQGTCPAGEVYAKRNIAEKKIPVISCEGPCIRGEVARLAVNILAEEAPYARCCYAETLLVPHSSMTEWVKGAETVVVTNRSACAPAARLLIRPNGRRLL